MSLPSVGQAPDNGGAAENGGSPAAISSARDLEEGKYKDAAKIVAVMREGNNIMLLRDLKEDEAWKMAIAIGENGTINGGVIVFCNDNKDNKTLGADGATRGREWHNWWSRNTIPIITSETAFLKNALLCCQRRIKSVLLVPSCPMDIVKAVSTIRSSMQERAFAVGNTILIVLIDDSCSNAEDYIATADAINGRACGFYRCMDIVPKAWDWCTIAVANACNFDSADALIIKGTCADDANDLVKCLRLSHDNRRAVVFSPAKKHYVDARTGHLPWRTLWNDGAALPEDDDASDEAVGIIVVTPANVMELVKATRVAQMTCSPWHSVFLIVMVDESSPCPSDLIDTTTCIFGTARTICEDARLV